MAVPTRDVVRITLAVAATLLGLFLIFLVRHVVLLIGVAIFLAVAMEPGIAFLQRWITSRRAAVAVMILAVITFIGLFIASIVPPIATQIGNLNEDLPKYRAQLQDESTPLGSLERRFEITEKLEGAGKGASRALGNVGNVLGTFASALADLVIVLALTVYFLVNIPKLKQQASSMLPTSRRKRTMDLIDLVSTKVGGWMQGNILISFVAGIVSFVVLLIIGVPFPAALAMWVAIADLIPMVGATLGALVCVIVAFFGGVVPGVLTIIFFVIYQQVENYVISPRVMKRAVDVSALAVIIAALIGGTLLGPIGILIAVPVAATIKVVGREMLMARKEPVTVGDPVPAGGPGA